MAAKKKVKQPRPTPVTRAGTKGFTVRLTKSGRTKDGKNDGIAHSETITNIDSYNQARRYVRVHGIKGDGYQIINREKQVVSDYGTVGSKMSNGDGTYGDHFLNSGRKKK